jgi:hypothetical protein
VANSNPWESVLAALTKQSGGQGIEQFSATLEQLQAADQAQADAITRNMIAVVQNTTSTGDSGSGLKTAGSILRLFGSGLSVTPLIGGLVKLFGGGDKSEAPPPLMEYAPPAPLQFEGAVQREAGWTEWSTPEAAGRGRPEAVVMPQVTVQVNAMDSRSFLDHSDEIARAVKQAMLNSHGLNDVVSEL